MLGHLARWVALCGAFLIAERSFGAVVEVVPSRITVLYGRVDAGSVASLSRVDGECLRMCRFTVPNSPVDPVTFRVEALVAGSTLQHFEVTSRQATVGLFRQSLNLFDWNRKVFDPTTNVTTLLGPGFGMARTQVNGDPARFVRASDGKMMGLVRVRPVGPTVFQSWAAEFDKACFAVVLP